MSIRIRWRRIAFGLCLLTLSVPHTGISAQGAAGGFQPPPDIEFRTADVMSEGVRLQAEIFSPRALSGQRLPVVVSAHGWGGTMAALRTDAVDIARAGYLVVNFDYRGWGRSDGRVILTGPLPADQAGATFTAQVEEIRGYIDPFEQTEDWYNVISWIMAEPMADTSRIGVRGSSYSGGHVVYIAAFEPRIKAVVSQVAATDITAGMPRLVDSSAEEATLRARGEIGYPEPLVRQNGLTGLPIKDKALRHSPNRVADRVRVPTLFIVAEGEELFTNESQSLIAYAKVDAPKQYLVIPDIAHYGIYTTARDQAVSAAVEWFDRYLKP
jgi:uncharacterized protein